ncbi:MAG: LysR family transcriptional regulator [Chloroflexi bacterium]|jgi:DNA-binding transcriptional LysR family regulator|nr:LysR family transcriptional regulator [Chloroflexota bacterium]
MLDTHQLNVFLIAAETLNFTQAARLLHMSQPSVSQHIQTLEQSFGHPLFVRLGRRIELTDSGEALVPLAREMVRRSIQIEETMKSLEGEVHGHLLVGCSTTPGKYILPQLLARFHHLNPKVRVSCTVASQGEVFRMLCDGEVHVAMISEPYMSSRDVETKIFMTDPMTLIVPLSHPWALRGAIDPEELSEGEFIFREVGSGTETTVRRALAEAGIATDSLNTLLVLGSSEAIALSVQEGIGVGFVSNIVLTKLVEGRVAPIRVKGLEIERDIYIGTHIRRPATVAQRVFWDFIKGEIARQEEEPVLVPG